MLPGAEILIDEPMAKRGRRMLEALADTAPAGTMVSNRYTGKRTLLVLYGVGRDEKYAAFKKHMKGGGHVACWDLGYWDREDAMRVSINNLHPTAGQLALAPPDACRKVWELREDADPAGHILLVGLGLKSAHLYGLSGHQWELAQVERLRRDYPGRRIVWRPKGKDKQPLPGTSSMGAVSIEEALRGAALVVCRHSNVAIDACIAGIPVDCEDGAARSLYADGGTPTREQRAEFLRRLGFWNWRPTEAIGAWDWIVKVIA